MARRARLQPSGIPLHIVHRGHNRTPCFLARSDYARYLKVLAEFAQAFGCHVHAYVLMPNHVHLLVTAESDHGASDLMKKAAQVHAQYMNWKHKKSGALWGGRFHSSPIQTDAYLFACYRYIEMNPVRAGMVLHPRDYEWSSYRSNAEGMTTSLLDPHSGYLALGPDPASRGDAYRQMFSADLDDAVIDEIRAVTQGNFALGTPEFHERLRSRLGVRTQTRGRGRWRVPETS